MPNAILSAIRFSFNVAELGAAPVSDAPLVLEQVSELTLP
jgi:hypothetical protein